jgi:hypothetical protein
MGLDVLDLDGLISGLKGCGYVEPKWSQLRSYFGDALNEFALFKEHSTASQFADVRGSEIRKHAPFVVQSHPGNICVIRAIDAERSQKLSSDLGISESELVCEAQTRRLAMTTIVRPTPSVYYAGLKSRADVPLAKQATVTLVGIQISIRENLQAPIANSTTIAPDRTAMSIRNPKCDCARRTSRKPSTPYESGSMCVPTANIVGT